MKHKAQDIVEFIVNKYGYIKKSDEFNISEWYGFEKVDGSLMRAKYISAYTQKEEYNVYQGELQEGEKAIAILNFNNGLFVYDIESFEEKMIVVEINENCLEVKKGKAKKNESQYEIDTMLLENINTANSTICGISQRMSDTDEVDYEAVKKLFQSGQELHCGYCGVSQKQIDELDKIYEEYNGYGLTKRPRGYKMEVDQMFPDKGYIEGNIILSCYWCNNAKTDTFLPHEFEEVARGINTVWTARLNQEKLNYEIKFPVDTYMGYK